MHLPLTRLDRYTIFFSPQWRSISSQLSPLFEKSILATPRQWADIYIHTGSAYIHTHTHIYTHVQRANFFVLRGSRAKILFSILLCVLTPRFRVATTIRPTPNDACSLNVQERNRSYPNEFFLLPAKILDTRTRSRFLLLVGFHDPIVSDRTEYRVTGTHRDWINSISRFFPSCNNFPERLNRLNRLKN